MVPLRHIQELSLEKVGNGAFLPCDLFIVVMVETFHFSVFDGGEKLLIGRFMCQLESFQGHLSQLWSILLLVQPATFVCRDVWSPSA